MRALVQFIGIVRKDIVIEFRAKDLLYLTAFFSFLLIVIFSFAFLSDPAKAIDYGPGIIWVTVLFSAILGLNRLLEREKENSCLWALLLSPVSPSTVFAAKVASHMIFTLLVEVMAIPMVFVFFDLRLENPAIFVAGLLLGTLGISLIGTIFATMLINARLKEVLLPLVTFPLLVPVLVAGVKITALTIGAPIAEEPASWLRFLLGFDMVFGAVTLALFGRMVRS